MTVTPDIAGDYLYVDGTETVTFTRRTDSATATCDGSQRQEVSASGLRLFGEIAANPDDMIWHLPKDELLTAGLVQLSPAPNDTIEDAAGVTWIVRDAVYVEMIEQWHVLSTRER